MPPPLTRCLVIFIFIAAVVLFWRHPPEVTLAVTRGGLTAVVLEELRAHSSLSPAHRTTAVGAGTQSTCSSTLTHTHTDPGARLRTRPRRRTLTTEDHNTPQRAGARRGAREAELLDSSLRISSSLPDLRSVGRQLSPAEPRMGPLLLCFALCASAAVPQRVKGEWKVAARASQPPTRSSGSIMRVFGR